MRIEMNSYETTDAFVEGQDYKAISKKRDELTKKGFSCTTIDVTFDKNEGYPTYYFQAHHKVDIAG